MSCVGERKGWREIKKVTERQGDRNTQKNRERERHTHRERQRKERNTEVGKWNKNFPLLGMTDTKVNDER